MKTFDELQAMTDTEKLRHLAEEVEKVISAAPPNLVLKLRALQARMDRIRSRIKNPQVSASLIYDEMVNSLLTLNETLKPLRKDK